LGHPEKQVEGDYWCYRQMVLGNRFKQGSETDPGLPINPGRGHCKMNPIHWSVRGAERDHLSVRKKTNLCAPC